MAAQHQDLGADVLKMIGIFIGNLLAHGINEALHFITAILSIAYLLWRWRRDYRKQKKEDANEAKY